MPTKEDGGELVVYAISAPQNTAKVEADFSEELQRALKGGFTDEEVAAAKQGYLQSREVSRGQDNELMGRLATEAYWGRRMAWDAELDRRLKALTAGDVNTALRKYVDPAKISIFKAGDFAKAKKEAAAAAVAPTTTNH